MAPQIALTVECEHVGAGWVCTVRVGDDARATHHRVTVDEATLRRLAPDATDPVLLVRESFRFLLAREPRESILTSFDLPVIGRYFPGYEASIRGIRPTSS